MPATAIVKGPIATLQQTVQSVVDTTSYLETLFRRFGRRLSAFLTPMGPFIDPGSDGYEDAERHGYILHARTLEGTARCSYNGIGSPSSTTRPDG